MRAAGRAPGPLAILGIAAGTLAFSGDHPVVLAALTAGAVALFAAARERPSRLYLLGGAVAGLTLALLNPFLVAEGDLIIWRGPEVPVIDLEITREELAAGAAIGVRLFTVAVLVGALLAHADADRLQAQVARVAPRSALAVALAARLLPTLERDARAISEAARLRGLDLAAGSWPGRARRAAGLALPLVGSSLERGLDVAEAMAARGYGGGGARSRLRERPWDAVEWALAAIGLGLAALAALAIALGLADYAYYPLLDDPLGPAALAVAGATAAALGAAAWSLRR